MKQRVLQVMFAVLLCASVHAQVNSGSNDNDGATLVMPPPALSPKSSMGFRAGPIINLIVSYG